jgi:hypothetical protein
MSEDYNNQEKITEKEFARRIGFHPETVAEWRRNGKIVHCKSGRRIYYLAPKHIDAFHERNEKRPKAA